MVQECRLQGTGHHRRRYRLPKRIITLAMYALRCIRVAWSVGVTPEANAMLPFLWQFCSSSAVII